jgi:hypothetical protein
MPSNCWFTPDDASYGLINSSCQSIVDEIKQLEKRGDPIGISLRSAHELLDDLYYGKCPEKEEHEKNSPQS